MKSTFDPERLMEYLRSYWHKHQRPPTMREIMSGCNMHSTFTVASHLDRLVERGDIERDLGVSRGIKLVEKATAP